ncbi:MAG: GNAT family N-acetyltransferase [Gemmatimonadota bacterium]
MSDLHHIRPAALADVPAIAAVHVASWRTTYPGIVAQDHIDRVTVEAQAARWERRLADPTTQAPSVMVAADASENLIGFASGGSAREESEGYDAELFAIYLLKEAQGRGVGRRLFNAVAAELRSRGHRALYVRVLSANPACNFYERLGGRRLKEASLTLGDRQYPETWYGWEDINAVG